MSKRVLAFDFGASSGRAILGTFDGERIHLDEIHRFTNDPVNLNGALYWDMLKLFTEIKDKMIFIYGLYFFGIYGIQRYC